MRPSHSWEEAEAFPNSKLPEFGTLGMKTPLIKLSNLEGVLLTVAVHSHQWRDEDVLREETQGTCRTVPVIRREGTRRHGSQQLGLRINKGMTEGKTEGCERESDKSMSKSS